MTIKIRCLKPPIVNKADDVKLWNVGDEAEVELNGYWTGQIERGAVEVVLPDDPELAMDIICKLPACAADACMQRMAEQAASEIDADDEAEVEVKTEADAEAASDLEPEAEIEAEADADTGATESESAPEPPKRGKRR